MMEWIQVLYEPQGHQTNSPFVNLSFSLKMEPIVKSMIFFIIYDQDLMEVREHGGTRYDGASRDTSSLAHISAAREKSSEKGLVRDTLAICCAKWPCPLLPLCTRENNIMILGSSADARMLSEKSQFMEYTLALNLRT
ncbi:hypothetical protein ROHU_005714 [Labeo rohita]|uniref:Uncharacterized protein n=1 Tax=Labeo rohita TaxID=84645 RepID=A0A498N0T0_LABRO|nr:hypothetical protein ROHU_005714 [Labeo rohita]